MPVDVLVELLQLVEAPPSVIGQDEHHVVDVAPAPVLAGLDGAGYRMAGSCACLLACLFGEESQQPILPHVWHMRRCIQSLPIFRHSSQPAIRAGGSRISIRSRCEQPAASLTLALSPFLPWSIRRYRSRNLDAGRKRRRSADSRIPSGGQTRQADTVLDAHELELIDAYWRAANYLSVGQIYLLDNPLLREPLQAEQSSRGCSATSARRPA